MDSALKRVSGAFVARFAFLAVVLACATTLVWAQTVTGLVTGTVTDPSGQVIVGATVTLINEATGDSRTTSSEQNGSFVFPAVQPGASRVLRARRREDQGRGGYNLLIRAGSYPPLTSSAIRSTSP